MECGVCRVHEGFIGDADVVAGIGEKYDLLRDFSHDRDSLPRWNETKCRTSCVGSHSA